MDGRTDGRAGEAVSQPWAEILAQCEWENGVSCEGATDGGSGGGATRSASEERSPPLRYRRQEGVD